MYPHKYYSLHFLDTLEVSLYFIFKFVREICIPQEVEKFVKNHDGIQD